MSATKSISLLESRLCRQLESLHEKLLADFLVGVPNEHRVRILSFCSFVNSVAQMAEVSPFGELANQATWLLWYWRQREYGDSQLTELPEAEWEDVDAGAATHLRAFEPALDSALYIRGIEEAFARASTGRGPAKHSPWRLSSVSARLKEIVETSRIDLLAVINRTLAGSNPALFEAPLLDLLNGGILRTAVEWEGELFDQDIAPVKLAVRYLNSDGLTSVVVSKGPLGPDAVRWAVMQEIQREVDTPVLESLKRGALR